MSYAETNGALFAQYDQAQQPYFVDWDRRERKYRGNPYTDAQLKKIRKMGLENISIPVYKPIIDTIVHLLHSNKNSVTAVPMSLSENDSNKAYLIQALLTALFQIDRWPAIYERILVNQFVHGIGFALVDVDANSPFGCKLKYIKADNK